MHNLSATSIWPVSQFSSCEIQIAILVVLLKGFWVCNSCTGLHIDTRNDPLYGDLDLLSIDGILLLTAVSEGENKTEISGRTGISWTSKIREGTCLALSPVRIALLISVSNVSVKLWPARILTNKSTCSSESCGLRCPTQMESSRTPENLSRTEYISAEPKRTPPGFRTPSLGW
jgi:hypothetical protein